MDHTVKAEGLIWLIIGVFWVITQIAGAAAKKTPPRPPLSEEEESGGPAADPLTELLRKMAGTGGIPAEPLRPPIEVPVKNSPLRAAKAENPWKPGDIEKLPDIKPLQQSAPTTPSPAPAAPKVDLRPKMSAFRSSVPSIKLPAMSLSFQGSATSIGKAPNLEAILNPSDKNALRRAMLCHLIFSPPKALEQPARKQL